MSHAIAARTSGITEKPRTVETSESQRAFTCPSLSDIDTSGLEPGLGGPRAMSPFVSVDYECGQPGIPIHLDLTPQSPMTFPSSIWKSDTPNTFERTGLRNSGLSWSGPGTSLLDPEPGHSVTSRMSIQDEVPELPAIFRPLVTPTTPSNPKSLSHQSAITQPEPALSPGLVACRSCGRYHLHGFSHAYDSPRNSGSGAWWRNSKSKIFFPPWQRRESQSTFFKDNDDISEESTSPLVSSWSSVVIADAWAGLS